MINPVIYIRCTKIDMIQKSYHSLIQVLYAFAVMLIWRTHTKNINAVSAFTFDIGNGLIASWSLIFTFDCLEVSAGVPLVLGSYRLNWLVTNQMKAIDIHIPVYYHEYSARNIKNACGVNFIIR